MKAVRVLVTGRVQGVWFRASTKEQADARGVCGWVRNLEDGRVEALFEGEEDDVDAVLEWCRTGPERARVDKISLKPVEEQGHSEFTVLRK